MNEDQEEKQLKGYEMAYLLSPQTPEGEVSLWTEKLVSLIAQAGGSVRETPQPKRQILAYPVQHHKQAFFGWLIFTAPKDSPEKIKEGLKHNQVLLRTLIIAEQRETKPRVSALPLKSQKTPLPPPEQRMSEEMEQKIEEAVAAAESTTN